MGRPKKMTPSDIAHELMRIKQTVLAMRDAMPSAAKALRNEAVCSLDDLVREVMR